MIASAMIASATWFVIEDKVCDPLENNVMFSFSGFRIQRQYIYGFSTLHHVRPSLCDMGFVDAEAYVVTDRNTDINLGTEHVR